MVVVQRKAEFDEDGIDLKTLVNFKTTIYHERAKWLSVQNVVMNYKLLRIYCKCRVSDLR